MRLVTLNLLHGRSLSDGLVNPDRLAAAVRTLDADVLGLQEVDRDQERSGRADLTGAVAAEMGAADGDWRFAPALIGTPGGTWRAATDADDAPGESAYGVGLVSRLPVSRWRVVRLAAARMRSPIMLPGTRRVILLDDEPRVGLAAVIETASGLVTVATTHLSFVPGWNAVQLRRLVRGLRDLPQPQVLLGDLNMPGPLPRWVSRWRSLAQVKTYPAPEPSIQLDHVLAHGVLPAVTSAAAVEVDVSDHRALVVDLAVPRAARRDSAAYRHDSDERKTDPVG